MANLPFDREIINQRERPLSSDINQAQSQIERTLRETLMRLCLPRYGEGGGGDVSGTPLTGFIGEAFKPRPMSPLGMTIKLPAGLGFFYDATDLPSGIGGIAGVDDLSVWKPLMLTQDVTITVPAAPGSPNSRYDIIEVKPNRRTDDTASRDVLNPVTGVFVPTLVPKTLAWNMEGSVGVVAYPANNTAAIGYKTGTPGTSPTPPPVTAGYVKIAEVLVGTGVTTLDADVLNDLRRLVFPYACPVVSARISLPLSASPYPTLQQAIAPPGVMLVAYGLSVTNGQVRLLIFPGSGRGAVASAVAETLANNVAVTSGFGTVDPTIQTALQTSAGSPQTKVAVGQPYHYIELKTSGSSGTENYQVVAMMNSR